MHALAGLAAATEPVGSEPRMLIAALLGIAGIVLLITMLDLHPFLALSIGGIAVGIGAGMSADTAVESFSKGFGSTMGGVGLLIGFGAMFGKLLADSGGADRVVDTLLGRSSEKALPWTMALIGAVIGLPMFFEVGLVLLMPVIVLVARRSGQSLIKIAIPAMAGLSVMHGLVPPHPGPLVAIEALKANLGVTLALGVAIAIPTVVVSGPLFGKLAAKWVNVGIPPMFDEMLDDSDKSDKRPGFAITMSAIGLPVVLMLAKALFEVADQNGSGAFRTLIDFLGTPVVALAAAVLYGMWVLGRGAGMDRKQVAKSLESSLPPIAGILLIVGAGGGFKQLLVDTGIAELVADQVKSSSLPVLFLAWLIAVLIRLAVGSATVATVTAAGILAPVAADLSQSHVALMALAIGSGSLFLSHVNDAGFWMVKEYLGTTVGQTLKTWSLMECVISVCGLLGVLAASVIV